MISGFGKIFRRLAVLILCLISTPAIQAMAKDTSGQGASALHMLDPSHPILLAAGSSIVAEGDSLTYGSDRKPSGIFRPPINGSLSPRSPTPYPETLAADLEFQVTVINRGYPGDRTVEGLKRWESTSSGDLTLIMYGTNDCENFGRLPNGELSKDEYRAALTALVKRRQDKGVKAVILTPPPLQDKNQEQQLQPYRAVDADVAAKTGAYLFDTVKALRDIPDPWTDGVHLKPEAYAAIAHALAASIKIQDNPSR